MNTETDQEVTILLNQYGLNDLRGPNRLVLERLSPGRTTLKRQLIENEDYSQSACSTRYHQAQVVPVVLVTDPETDLAPKSLKTEKSSHQDEYHIHLQMTSPWPKPPRMNQLHLVVLWEQVLKAHAAKVRPASPAPKAMPDQTSTSRRPPDLPETPRKSTEKGKYNRSFDQIAP